MVRQQQQQQQEQVTSPAPAHDGNADNGGDGDMDGDFGGGGDDFGDNFGGGGGDDGDICSEMEKQNEGRIASVSEIGGEHETSTANYDRRVLEYLSHDLQSLCGAVLVLLYIPADIYVYGIDCVDRTYMNASLGTRETKHVLPQQLTFVLATCAFDAACARRSDNASLLVQESLFSYTC